MKKYDLTKIRNVALVGASSAGKTTLTEHLLFHSKTTTRVGKVEDGNTVMDYQKEEKEKGMSLNLGLGHIDWKQNRINLIDTPGYPDFAGEQIFASKAVETLVFVANAVSGYDVSLEQSFDLFRNSNIARALIVNRMSSENADYKKVIEQVTENAGLNVVPIYVPIGSEAGFKGIVDIIKNEAFKDDKKVDIPSEMTDEIEEMRNELMEAVAESDDDLLEKFFEEGELSDEEMIIGLKKAILAGSIVPAFPVSALEEIGLNKLLDAFINYFPSPNDKNTVTVIKNEEEKQIVVSEDGEKVGYVFKSISDPIIGDIALIRMFSGTIKSGDELIVPEKDSKERIGSMYYLQGKNKADAEMLRAGEIGGLVKLKYARTFNSLVESGKDYKIPAFKLPTHTVWKNIVAVNQHDEDKIGEALNKLLDEDATLSLEMNPETNENILSGLGGQQIELIKKKLLSRFKIEAELVKPSVAYRETLMGKAEVKYKHKKQSGGKGQYGEVYFRVKSLPRGDGNKFVNSVTGGTIPSKYIPAIEKGLYEIWRDGILSGNKIVDVEVDVYFGSYHDVDSSEMAFKIATWQCLKKAFEVAKPILLEPVHDIQIIIPTEYMGDVMGDITTRRGKISGMEQEGKKQILNAEMPLSELYSYFPSLKSLTQGRGKFIQSFSHYEKVPNDVAQK
ncbi:MAG: elongation factor G, partial [Candidatus Cloacimonadota bacterium]|nr:elongation factor G [Candidatus Cloacimonadota bacterium]